MNSKHQIETILTGEIGTLYKEVTGQHPDVTVCQFLNPTKIALVLENFVTPVEQLFLDDEQRSLARDIRRKVDRTFHTHLRALVEQYTHRPVIDVLSESKLDTGRKSIILILKPQKNLDAASNGLQSEYAS